MVQIETRIASVPLYRDLLEKFLGFYEPLQDAIETHDTWPRWGLDMHERRTSEWLKQDLQALGATEGEVAELPRCREIPDCRTLARAFGCAYVLEGSTLGGKHIAVMLDKSDIPAAAQRFFHGRGAEVLPMWKIFCQSLEKFGQTSSDADEVITSASTTFESLEYWINKGAAS